MASALAIVQKRFPSVTSVTDAKKSLFLDVSKQDSASSNPKDHQNCALAKACKRTQQIDGVLVSLSTAYVIVGKVATRYHIPQYAQREIVAFDRRVGFTPGTYEFTAPPKTDRLGKRDAKRKVGGSHGPANGGLAKRFRHKTSGVRAALN